MAQHRAPGFLAIAHIGHDTSSVPGLTSVLSRLGLDNAPITRLASGQMVAWDLGDDRPTPAQPLLLSSTNWSEHGSADPATIDRWLTTDPPRPAVAMLPPFGAIAAIDDGVILATDTMGFRQAFRCDGPGWSAISTSARALAALGPDNLDTDAVRLQSLLGWQLSQRTIFEGVSKLRPGEYVRLGGRGIAGGIVARERTGPVSLDEAVTRAATMLRSFLERYLDENPDPVLQLTGGQDSRLVLSAIPPARRKGLRVMTMGTAGTPDVDIAAHIAARYGMDHLVRGLEGLTRLTPEDSFNRVCWAATRMDCMADPIAKAATIWAEESFPQGARLSGLGGELARGFYYTGRLRESPVTRGRAERLARWRMFANESVEVAALDAGFVAGAQISASDAVYRSLAETGLDWFRATDVLYHDHRMQRWAGLSESAVCLDREIVNPMLDDRFRDLAEGMKPADKGGGRFLARLQVELDPDLASIPLDNRPAPAALARPGLSGQARYRASMATRAARKVRQRAGGQRRPPAGGPVLARKVIEHLARVPETIDPVREYNVFGENWLDSVVARQVVPAPASLALLVNLVVALDSPPSM